MVELTNDDKIELRKKQFEIAMEGDVRMLIWLGKNYLGQTESTMKITGEDEICEGFDLAVIGGVCENCGERVEVDKDEYDENDIIDYRENEIN